LSPSRKQVVGGKDIYIRKSRDWKDLEHGERPGRAVLEDLMRQGRKDSSLRGTEDMWVSKYEDWLCLVPICVFDFGVRCGVA